MSLEQLKEELLNWSLEKRRECDDEKRDMKRRDEMSFIIHLQSSAKLNKEGNHYHATAERSFLTRLRLQRS